MGRVMVAEKNKSFGESLTLPASSGRTMNRDEAIAKIMCFVAVRTGQHRGERHGNTSILTFGAPTWKVTWLVGS